MKISELRTGDLFSHPKLGLGRFLVNGCRFVVFGAWKPVPSMPSDGYTRLVPKPDVPNELEGMSMILDKAGVPTIAYGGEGDAGVEMCLSDRVRWLVRQKQSQPAPVPEPEPEPPSLAQKIGTSLSLIPALVQRVEEVIAEHQQSESGDSNWIDTLLQQPMSNKDYGMNKTIPGTILDKISPYPWETVAGPNEALAVCQPVGGEVIADIASGNVSDRNLISAAPKLALLWLNILKWADAGLDLEATRHGSFPTMDEARELLKSLGDESYY